MTDRRRSYAVAAIVLGVVVAASATNAWAVPTDNALDQVVQAYRAKAAAWQAPLRDYALGLFGGLAVIEMTWAAGKLVLRNATFSEWTAEVFGQFMFIGFFLALLMNSGAWATAVVDSFRQAGNAAAMAGGGSSNLSPADVFDTGLKIFGTIATINVDFSLEGTAQALGYLISALIILVCFALLTAGMISALIESYVAISASTLFMGFGGSRWTKDWALKPFTYCISVGAKLFVIQLLVGTGEAMIKDWAATLGPNSTFTEVGVMIGLAIVMLMLVMTIPNTLQSLLNGASPGSHQGLVGAATAVGGAVAGVGMAMAGGAFAAGSAMKLASEQIRSSEAESGEKVGGLRGLGMMAQRTAMNLGSAAADDLGAKLGGRAHHGTAAGRMGYAMSQEAGRMSEDRRKNERRSAAMSDEGEAAPAGASSAAGSIVGAPMDPVATPEPMVAGAGPGPVSSEAGSMAGTATAGGAGSPGAKSGVGPDIASAATASAPVSPKGNDAAAGPGRTADPAASDGEALGDHLRTSDISKSNPQSGAKPQEPLGSSMLGSALRPTPGGGQSRPTTPSAPATRSPSASSGTGTGGGAGPTASGSGSSTGGAARPPQESIDEIEQGPGAPSHRENDARGRWSDGNSDQDAVGLGQHLQPDRDNGDDYDGQAPFASDDEE